MDIIKNLIILFISGFIIGIIFKYNIMFGLFVLLISLLFFIWSFYKKIGYFKNKRDIPKLIILLICKMIGFILATLNIIKFENKYFIPFLLVLLFIYALSKGLSEAIRILKK